MTYPKALRAQRAATTMSKKVQSTLRPYYCYDCRGYHLTNMSQAQYRFNQLSKGDRQFDILAWLTNELLPALHN